MAEFVGKGAEVSEVTKLAMTGALPFEDALDARLKTINMTESLLNQLIDSKPTRLSEGAAELIAELQKRGIDIYIISGSFSQAIYPISDKLGIPKVGQIFILNSKIHFCVNRTMFMQMA